MKLIRALVQQQFQQLWQPWWLLTNICWVLTVPQILSILHILLYFVLSTNLEIGTVAFCILKMGKLWFKPQMSCLRSRGKSMGNQDWNPMSNLKACALDHCTALLLSDLWIDKPKVVWTLNHHCVPMAGCLLLPPSCLLQNTLGTKPMKWVHSYS